MCEIIFSKSIFCMNKLFSLILVLGLLLGGNSNAETIIHCKHFKDNSSIILKLDNNKKSLFIQDIGKIEISKYLERTGKKPVKDFWFFT